MAHIYPYRIFFKVSLLLGIFCLFVGLSFGQTPGPNTPFEIRWSFTGNVNGNSYLLNTTTPFPFFTPANAITANSRVQGYQDGKAIIVDQWSANTALSTEYIEVSFAPTSNGYEYNITEVEIILSRAVIGNNEGVRSIDTRLARDGYIGTQSSTTNIAIYPATTSIKYNPFIINRSVLTGLRIYGYNRQNAQSQIIVDEIIFRGTTTNAILPVNLTSFNAQAVDSQVELAWETAWERNSREFIVQRSSNLKEFGDIGRVAAAGTTNGIKQYTFTDNNPLPGVNYYRLRMVDRDDTYEYSKVKDVIFRPGTTSLWVSANPTSGERIRLHAPDVDASRLRLTTLMGQAIPFQIQRVNSEYTELVPSIRLAPGMYFLTLYQDGVSSSTKLMVN